MKQCLIYLTHRWSFFISDHFKKIYNELSNVGVDVFIFYDSILENNIEFKKTIQYNKYMFNHNKIHINLLIGKDKYRKLIDPYHVIKEIMLENKDVFSQYKYTYFYEYDVYFDGDLGEYIKTLNNYDDDLIASYITDDLTKLNRWIHYGQWLTACSILNYKNDIIDNLKYIRSCISFFRINTEMLYRTFDKKYEFFTDNSLYELHIPTLINYFGGTIKSIGPDESNKYYIGFTSVKNKSYSATVFFYSIKYALQVKLQNNWPDKLFYTRIKH